jgi:hypothetical protein
MLNFYKNHSFLRQAINYYVKNYDIKCYACNGPILFRNLIDNDCRESNEDRLTTREMSAKFRTIYSANRSFGLNMATNYVIPCDLYIYPAQMVCPVHSEKAQTLFSDPSDQFDRHFFDNVYTIHFYNKLSAKYNVTDSGNVYREFASKHCPFAFDLMRIDSKKTHQTEKVFKLILSL